MICGRPACPDGFAKLENIELQLLETWKHRTATARTFKRFLGKAEKLQNSSEQDHSLVMRRWNLQMHIETLACGWYQCFGSVRHLDSSFCFAFTPRIINNMTTMWSSLSRPRHQNFIYRCNIFVPDEDDSFWTIPHLSLRPKQKRLHHSLIAQDAGQYIKCWQQLWQYYCCH